MLLLFNKKFILKIIKYGNESKKYPCYIFGLKKNTEGGFSLSICIAKTTLSNLETGIRKWQKQVEKIILENFTSKRSLRCAGLNWDTLSQYSRSYPLRHHKVSEFLIL